MRLWDCGPQRQSALAAYMETSAPTVAKMVTRLERSGFVTRAKAADDARAVTVSLTDKGKQAHDELAAVWTDLEQRTLRGLDENEQKTLKDLLIKLIVDLHDPD